MKTLVTGANGFLGSAIMRRLLKAGHDVRVLVRAQSDRRNLNNFPVEICKGDLCDAASIKRAVNGCDNLFHVAADYRLWIPDPEVMYATNVTGTQSLILAAAEAGLKRMVYTSSVATLGLNPDGSPADENTASSLSEMTGHYKRSKFLAEQAVRQLTDQHKLPLVIVNPSTPIGPCDIKPTPTGCIILDTLLGRMPAYVNTGLNVVHADDVAHGHLLAFDLGQAGERYVLGGENMSLLQILEMIDELTGKKSRRIRLSHNLVLPAAWLMEKTAAYTGKEPRATIDSVRMAKNQMFFSSAKAIRELNYGYRPAKEAIKDAILWFRENGYCK
ncbi:MAG: NAD-dependent epimerase/dehydratase family protein [Methylococcales bacterium]|nr:NAD-dependent epimerase/dehydratase family protein [Methylococcales bacterium]